MNGLISFIIFKWIQQICILQKISIPSIALFSMVML